MQNQENNACELAIGEPARDLRERLMQFSLRILKLCAAMPATPEAKLIRGQLFRSGTSPGAQHREAGRARSNAEFVSKLQSAQQELDESSYWLEILDRAAIGGREFLIEVQDLRNETEELLRIFSASLRTEKGRDNQ